MQEERILSALLVLSFSLTPVKGFKPRQGLESGKRNPLSIGAIDVTATLPRDDRQLALPYLLSLIAEG
jgi:hypothetical protein